jgi:hypothetical protein
MSQRATKYCCWEIMFIVWTVHASLSAAPPPLWTHAFYFQRTSDVQISPDYSTSSAFYWYYLRQRLRSRPVCNLLLFSVSAKSIQNAKVQRAHAETRYSGMIYNFPIFLYFPWSVHFCGLILSCLSSLLLTLYSHTIPLELQLSCRNLVMFLFCFYMYCVIYKLIYLLQHRDHVLYWRPGS